MTTLTVGPNGFNENQFFNLDFSQGIVLSESSTLIVESTEVNGVDYTFDISGSFDYTSEQTLLDSIVSGMTFLTSGGTLVVAISNIDENFSQLNAIETNADLFTGNDTIQGGAGNDTLTGYGGNNTLNGGGGTNTLDYTEAPAGVTVNVSAGTAQNGYGGTDSFTNFQDFLGSAYNDTFIAGPGSNSYNGEGGVNTLSYALATNPVTVNLSTGTVVNGWGGTDTFTDITDFVGGAANDVFILPQTPSSNYSFDGGGGTNTLESPNWPLSINLLTNTVTVDGETVAISNITVFEGVGDFVGGPGNHTVVADTTNYTTLDYSAAPSGVSVNMSTGVASNGYGGTDEVSNFTTFWLSAGSDTFIGATYPGFQETVHAGAGNNTIVGGSVGTILSYTTAPGPITIDLGNDTVQNGYGGVDSFSNLFEIIGNSDPSTVYYGPDIGQGTHFIEFYGSQNTLNCSEATSNLLVLLSDYNAVSVTGTFNGVSEPLNVGPMSTVIGGPDDDQFSWGGGQFTIDGAGGTNTLQLSAQDNYTLNLQTDAVTEGATTEVTFANFQDFTFDDPFYSQTVVAGPGNHVFQFQVYSAYTPVTMNYSAAPNPIDANLAAGTIANGYGGTDTFLSQPSTVIGSAGNDTFIGGSTPVSFEGGGGDDSISGINVTAVYTGPRADYTITHVSGDTITVTDDRTGSPDGTDTLTDVGHLQFADQTILPTYQPAGGTGTMSSELWVTRIGALAGNDPPDNFQPSSLMPAGGGFASMRSGGTSQPVDTALFAQANASTPPAPSPTPPASPGDETQTTLLAAAHG